MTTRRILQFLAFAAALAAGPALAHHSIKMIDVASPQWLSVTVISYEPRNPHVLIHVQENRPDGAKSTMTLEGPIMRRLQEMHLAKDFIKPGDVLEVCGFPFTQDVVATHFSTAGLPPLPALHAHLLVLPDGRWQPWGPYGKLDNCVRAGDTPQRWADFINAVPMGLEYWCKGLSRASVPSVAPKTFVEDVNRQLSSTCR
jgi:uncharacterized protein DUF6152